MSTLMTALRRVFGGGAADRSVTPAPGPRPVVAGDAKKDRLKAEEEFKTAVRDGDIASIGTLLDTQRIAMADELGGGRGLLQFAVMAKSVKAVTLLMSRGADASTRDSLGASAATLGKSGSEGMIRALQPA